MLDKIEVSVIIPVRNEEKYILRCFDSLMRQDYPFDKMEFIFVDGDSTDRTVEILKNMQEKTDVAMKILHNPEKIVSCAMNIGLEAAVGKYIVRLDAHAEYNKDYISKSIYWIEKTGADNVGGLADTKGNGFLGGAIAKVLSSKFGVGNSQFRTQGKSGYVDTVPFGTFRRDLFCSQGGYNEKLVRNEDNEINYRIRKRGGRIFMSDEIRFIYYCRDSFRGISTMARQNGIWNVITMKMCPGSMGIRHFIPLLFVLSIIVLGVLGVAFPLFWSLLAAEITLYTVLDILFSIKQASNMREFFTLTILFPLFHVMYGIGSLIGIFKLFSKKYRKDDCGVKKISIKERIDNE